MTDVIASLGIILAALALVFAVYQNINVDKQVKKRVKEELAPYREVLEATKSLIKRPSHEIMGSMTRYTGTIDSSKLTVINAPIYCANCQHAFQAKFTHCPHCGQAVST